MQVTYRCMALLGSWSSLQRIEDRNLFTEVLHSWRIRRMILLSDMGGCIIIGLQLLLFSRPLRLLAPVLYQL
jgi:hypothetical protein